MGPCKKGKCQAVPDTHWGGISTTGQSRPDGLLIVGGRLKQQHIESCSYKERELFYVTNGPNNKL